jgi:hypothetical protein
VRVTQLPQARPGRPGEGVAAEEASRSAIFFTARTWEGQPEIREPHKCTELVWADPAALPKDALDFLSQAWQDAQGGRTLREYGFAHGG